MVGIKPSAALIKALKSFATCDETRIRLKYPYGGFLDGITMFYLSGDNGEGDHCQLFITRLTDKASPSLSKHFIMFMSQPPGMYSACWGGLMTTRARLLGAQGVIYLLEQGEMGLKFLRVTSRFSGCRVHESSEVNVLVQFKDDLWIHPGDCLNGDADGVVVIPAAQVQSVTISFEVMQNGELIGDAIKRLRK
ncbi:hypothetical protein V1527DRAFT_496737 [Lipomyces starkeyi]